METLNANNNTVEILIIVFGAIFLVLWLIWVIRLVIAHGRMKAKNRRLLAMSEKLDKLSEELMDEEETVRSQTEKLEAIQARRSSDGSAEGVAEAKSPSDKELWKKFTDTVKDRKMHLREKVSKDELAEVLGTDKKMLATLAAAMLPEGQTIMDWLDGLRLKAAIPLIKGHNERESGQDENETMNDVAKKAGFSGARSLNKAAKLHLGMSLGELRKIV